MVRPTAAAIKRQRDEAFTMLEQHRLATVNFKGDVSAKEYHKNLIGNLHDRDNFEQHMSKEYIENAPLTALLKYATENSTNPRYNATARGKDPDDAELLYELKRFAGHNLIMSLLTRLRSKDNAPFHLTVLSIIAYRTGMPHAFWKVLQQARVLESYEWTEQRILELTKLEIVPNFLYNLKICVAIYDNCSYYQRTSFQSGHAQNLFLNTVNWTLLPYCYHCPSPLHQRTSQMTFGF